MTRNNTMKIVYTFIAILVGIGIAFYVKENGKAKADGFITFKLYNKNGVAVLDEELGFNEGETLFDVLDKTYEITCADIDYNEDPTCGYDSAFGKAILGVENVKTDWWNNYLSIWINGNYANYGVSTLPFVDGDVIEIKWTDLS